MLIRLTRQTIVWDWAEGGNNVQGRKDIQTARLKARSVQKSHTADMYSS